MTDNLDSRLKEFQRELQQALKPFLALTRIKPGDAKVAATLDKAVAGIPDPDAAGRLLASLVARARSFVSDARQQAEGQFRSIEAEFVREIRQKNLPIRELDNGWRTDEFEVDVDRPHGRLRLMYNREIVQDWTEIRSLAAFQKCIADARTRLQKSAIHEAALRRALVRAHELGAGKAGGARVPMPEFYRQFRIALVEADLAGKPDKKIEHFDLPKWRFLYNIDRYRTLSFETREARITFETGSQADQGKGACMVLNGLRASDDYRSYCYAVRSEQG